MCDACQLFCLLLSMSYAQATAQQTAPAPANPGTAVVPQLVNFSGRALDADGKVVTGTAGVTFAIYSEQYEGAPLWLETQNIQPDSRGSFTAQLGAATSGGVPLQLFSSGQARWLGVRVDGGEEQPRVLLVSVPYALKAADAQTLGGLPPSAFVLAPGLSSGAAPSSTSPDPATGTGAATPAVGGSGTQNYIPIWTDSSGDLGNSILYQLGTGSSAKVGINNKSPLFTLDVNGSGLVRGLFEMATTNFATPTKGYNSQPFNLESSAYNSGTAKYTLNHFQWQAEPTGNNTTTPGATLNLLYGTDPNAPAETGLELSSAGVFTFAPAQTFPGTGTITGVAAGTDLKGGGNSGAVTLNLDTTKVPQLATANTFTGNQTVNGNLSATGVVSGSSYQIGSRLFALGSYKDQNAFLGFAGSLATAGADNTAVGYQAMLANTQGTQNTATGNQALFSDTTGGNNTANGSVALYANTQGAYNTASGNYALYSNTMGDANTAAGAFALADNSTGNYNTATGYGALATNVASFNTADGYQALYSNATGYENTAFGYQALYSNNGPNAVTNTASGYQTLYSNTTGQQNTASGYQALYSNAGGSGDTAFGNYALYSNTTGGGNTAVGYSALYGSNGNDLTCIGVQCTANADGLVNATAIGAHAGVGESNALVLGGTGQYAVKVGIGTATPSSILTIARGAGHPVSDSWETYSSRRWKTNIQTLPDALAKVEQLRGVSYDQKDSGKHEVGVIAEEVGKVVPELVTYEDNGKDARGVDYSRLTALLIEAAKEQQREIQHQQAALRAQAAAIRDLKSVLRATRQTLLKMQAQAAAAQPALVAVK